MKLFTEVKIEDLIDGDCVKIEFVQERKSMAKSNYGKIEKYAERTEHAYYQDGVFLSVIDNQPIEIVENSTSIFLHNYKFISLPDEWYIEGTECYPDDEDYNNYVSEDWKQDGWTLFQGVTYKDNFNEMEGTGPVWDGETCPFSEFKITERINQTRARKLNRIINE